MDSHPTPFPMNKSRGVVKPTSKPSKPLKKKNLKTQSTAETESSSQCTKEGSEFEFQYVSTEELYPTPYPVGKSCGIGKPVAKPSKPLNKDLKTQSIAQSQTQSRGKRTFGVARNPNILTEKNPETKPLKQYLKPTKPIKKSTPLSNSDNSKKSSDEKKKKELAVHFEGDDEVVMLTPLAVKKVSLEGESSTAYLTAQSCSKCRTFDALETASYWLYQISLAESVGKHLVSAAFFRLALQCNAQPIEKIHYELKNYMKKHNTDTAISHFADIFSINLNLEIESKNEELFSESSQEETQTETENYSSKEGQGSNSNQEGCLDSSTVVLNGKIKHKGKEIAKYDKRKTEEMSLSFLYWLTQEDLEI